MPWAFALAVAMIIGLYAAVAIVAPSFAPAFGLLGSGRSDARTDAATASAEPSAAATTSATPSWKPSASPSAKPQPSKASPSPVKDRITAWEDEVFRLVNVERTKAGCAKLHTDARLHKAARDFSALMAAKNFFDHVSPDGSSFVDREEDAGYPRNQAAAENIAYGYGDPAAVMKGWMNSTGHRKNILNCSIKAIGVGLAYRKSTPYWTQDFGWQ
jgi:uncharacterized protein YkwD